jgi:hypothetical protein
LAVPVYILLLLLLKPHYLNCSKSWNIWNWSSASVPELHELRGSLSCSSFILCKSVISWSYMVATCIYLCHFTIVCAYSAYLFVISIIWSPWDPCCNPAFFRLYK